MGNRLESETVMPTDPLAAFEWLRQMKTPRPFDWQGFVRSRRFWYGIAAICLLGFFVGLPFSWGIKQAGESATGGHLKPNQIAMYFGALFVVGFIIFLAQLNKQYENARWLSRHGTLGEANLLLVLNGGRNLFVSYRFWDAQGNERERDAVIVPDSPDEELPVLKAGDLVPLLYDPENPDKRNFLWVEIAKYVKLKNAQDASAAPTPTQAA